jgi:sugar/nucleoside kinase (ribokinase family)
MPTEKDISTTDQISPVVTLGPINPGLVLAVEGYPPANGGTFVNKKQYYCGPDAMVVAQTLARWGLNTHIITNALGDDMLGHVAHDMMFASGVHGAVKLRKDLHTPLEIDICDHQGKRTWFVENAWEVFGTIDSADFSIICNARILYVDWYTGDAVVTKGIDIARKQNVPIYLNIEYDPNQFTRYSRWIASATLVQTWINDDAPDAVNIDKVCRIGHEFCQMGAKMALVTRGKHGSVIVNSSGERVIQPALQVDVVGTLGAGAVFSAGAIYGYLNHWDLQKLARFATTAASLKCKSLIPHTASIVEIEKSFDQIKI